MYKYGEFINFHLVDIPDIESDISASNFDQQALELLANAIVETGCLLKPLILKQIAPMQLKVLSGHFEYHAAVLANKIDKKRVLSGMVSAFVVKKELESQAIKQVQLFAQNNPPNPVLETPNVSQNSADNSSITAALTKQIAHLTQTIQEMQQEARENAKQQAEFQQQLLQIIKGLSVPVHAVPITPIIPPPVAVHSPVATDAPDVPIPPVSYPSQDRSQKVLDALNNCSESELKQKLKQIDGFGEKKVTGFAKEIVKARHQLPFSSFSDIKNRVAGMGEATIKKIIQQFPV
jgi:hypothetical protein